MNSHTTSLLQRTLRPVCIVIVLFAFSSSFLVRAAAKNEKTKASKTSSNTTARSTRNRKEAPKTERDVKSARSNRNDNSDFARNANASRGRVNTKRTVARNGSRVETRKNLSARERNGHSTSSKQRRAVETQRAEARREAEAKRREAIARERERDDELRDQVQSMIAKDDVTGEDPEIRRAAVNALGNLAGTVVVMNPQTGRVYSIVNQQWGLREGFKPCSTIKLVTGLAGLNENVIDPNDPTSISDRNLVSLTRALAYSKNDYFQHVGEQLGFDKMLSYARRLGLGEKTGINARNEFQGRLPGSKAESAIHRLSSHGDHFEVTALQLATLVSAMGNGGKLLTPYIARTRQDEARFKTKVRRVVNIDREAWRHMVPGMVGAVNYGSGKRAHDPAQTVAGKTGTCIEQDRWVGLFTSYAPLANPSLAVVVIARGADARNHFPAAVAGRIYRELNGRLGTPAGLQVAATRSYAPSKREEFEGDDEEEKSAIQYSYEPNGTKRTQLAHPLASDSRTAGTVKPVLMSIPQQFVEPGVPLKTPAPASADGHTRPRRVNSR